MRTETEIYLDYQTSMNQAKELEELALELEQELLEKLAAIRSQLQNSWSGENADAFGSRLELTTASNQNLVRELRRVADGIKRIAENTYEAEKRAIEIAGKETALWQKFELPVHS